MKIHFLTAAVWLGLVGGVQASIVNYSFNGGALTPTSSDPNVNAPPVSLHFSTGTLGSNFGGSSSGNNVYVKADSTPSSSTPSAASVMANSIDFTITPNAGYAVNLSDLTFSFGGNTDGISSTYTTHYIIRSSLDGFANDISSGQVTVPNSTTTTLSSEDVDLSGTTYQNLTSAITFAIYVWDGTNSGSSYVTRVDNLTLDGAVVAPEPTSLGAIGFGFLLLAQRRRRAKA